MMVCIFCLPAGICFDAVSSVRIHCHIAKPYVIEDQWTVLFLLLIANKKTYFLQIKNKIFPPVIL
jgi:hypothetical protein